MSVVTLQMDDKAVSAHAGQTLLEIASKFYGIHRCADLSNSIGGKIFATRFIILR